MFLRVMEFGNSIPELQEATAHIVVVEAVDKLFLALCQLHFAAFEDRLGDWSWSSSFHTSLPDMVSEGRGTSRVDGRHCSKSSAGSLLL